MKMPSFQVYNGGVKLFFGINVIGNAEEFIKAYKRILLVTGRRSAKISGALDDVTSILDKHGIEYTVYNDIVPNPIVENVEGIVKAYKEFGAEAIIAIGGGSIIDSAKVARLVISGGGSVVDYLYGRKPYPEKLPFLLAINLTHGTGTEIDKYAVVSIVETKEKIGISAGYPNVSIDDPRYTRTLPRNQTIYTSIDAFAHSVESATSTRSSPYTWLLAEEAIKHIVKHLPRALEKPDDLEARYWLLYASMIAGISIDHGVTHTGHGLEHVFSGFNPKLPHGAGLAILYKALLQFFYKLDPEVMARILKPLDPELKPRVEDAEKAQKAYNKFLEEIGFNESFSTYGFSIEDVKEAVKFYYENEKMKRYHGLAPKLPSREDLEKWLTSLI